MQQRQLRLGDILDDYCPRERRVTNHAVVAMVGPDVKQTRCTTCDAEHEYKHAKVPRQRRKAETPAALYSQVVAGGPKRIAHDPLESMPEEPPSNGSESAVEEPVAAAPAAEDAVAGAPAENGSESLEDEERADAEREKEGPVHRPLIRASLPRPEGQPPPTRPAPEFTIRQPGGRQHRFRPRHLRGPQQFQGNRSNGTIGGGPPRGGMPHQSGGRPPQGSMTSRLARRHGPGRKRSK